jgi:hypothetical protein
MSKKNINDLLNFLDEIDSKLFANVKNLDDIDHEILKKFKLLNKNLDEIKNFDELQIITQKIANQMSLDSNYILKKYNHFKKLKII